MEFLRNSLLQFQIIHQVTLPDLNPLSFQKLLHLSYQQKNLHQFFIMTQKSTLPVEIPQASIIYSRLSCENNNLPHFLLLNQISTLLVDISQAFHILSHLTSYWRSLTRLHHVHQVTVSVEIPPHSRQKNTSGTHSHCLPQTSFFIFFIAIPSS